MLRLSAAVVAALVTAAFTVPLVPVAALADPCAGRDPFTEALTAELEARYPANRFTANVHDHRRDCRFSFDPDARHTTASVIKITVMVATLLRAQDEGRDLTAWEHAQVVPMIRTSDDASASNLWVSLGGAPGIQNALDQLGMTETTPVEPKWGLSETSAADQVDLVSGIVLADGPLDASRSDEARSFLLDVVAEQRWGVTAGVPDDWSVPLKNGFFPSTELAWRVNTVGFVEAAGGSGHAIAILSDGWPADEPGIEAVELIAFAINDRLLRGEAPDHDFVDVAEGSYYEDAVAWLADTEVALGVSPLFYAPQAPVTRGQMALFLHRLADEPFVPFDGRFVDVAVQSEYAAAVAWMVTNGITVGTTTTTFAPHAPLSRSQAALFLHRYAGLPDATSGAAFDDVADGASYADAVDWMVGAEITMGTDERTYGPHEPVSRAHLAAFLHRYDAWSEN